MTEQKPIQMIPFGPAAAANASPSSLQSVEAQTQHLAKRHLLFIGHIDEALDRFAGRLDVDLLISDPCEIHAVCGEAIPSPSPASALVSG
jgi:hypothetical protein